MGADIINGFFEFFGGLMVWVNVRQLLKDKRIKGVHWAPTVLFTLWGFWNLFYYPNLGQWFSFLGGLVIVSGNTMWIFLMSKYWKNK